MTGTRAVLLAVLLVPLAGTQTPPAPAPDPQTAQALSRGNRIAEAVSTVTSTAVSPLLGVSVLGAYEYYRTPPPRRPALPAYAQPLFFIPVIVLVVLIFAKEVVGSAAPLLKKPLDAVEVLLLNKASLLLIGFPVVVHEVARMLGFASFGAIFAAFEPVAYAQSAPAATGIAQTGEGALAVLLVILGSGLMYAVWVVGHAIDVLVLLSPFPMVDLVLKAFRVAVFGVVAGLTILDPRLAALVSAFVILISLLLAGWATRLLIFGAAYSWDLIATLILGSFHKPKPGEPLIGFTACKISGVPKRTLVRLRRREDGGLELGCRRWAIGPEKRVDLSAAASYEIGAGLLYPSLIETAERSSRYKLLVRLLPRYRRSEQDMAESLALKGVRDIRRPGALDSLWGWVREEGPAQYNVPS